jgi:hypothetical protein
MWGQREALRRAEGREGTHASGGMCAYIISMRVKPVVAMLGSMTRTGGGVNIPVVDRAMPGPAR